MQKIILLITGLASLVLAQEKTLHQLALEGIDYASTLQYKKAVAVFDRMIAREPENPQGHFLKSAVYFWMFSADMHNEALGEELRIYPSRRLRWPRNDWIRMRMILMPCSTLAVRMAVWEDIMVSPKATSTHTGTVKRE
jgi:hypothetical protein